MISFTSDASSLKKRENQAFMLRVMEQQLERMNINLMSILNKQIKKMLNCKRLFNAKRQDKQRFQVSKVDDERYFMSLVKKHKEITMSFT
jgi:hypothetical protein